MEIHFNLHSKKQGDGRQSILICFTGSDGQQKLFTGEKVKKKNWNGKKALKGEEFAATINQNLLSWETNIRGYYSDALRDGQPFTKEYVRSRLKEKAKPSQTVKKKEHSFFKVFASWIEQQKNDASITRKSRATINNYGQCITVLREMESRGYGIDFQGMDESFFRAYQRFLMNEKGLALNTFGKHVRRLKTFLKWADIVGYPVNRYYQLFKAPEKYVGVDYISYQGPDSELARIQAIDFNNTETKERFGLMFEDTENFKNKQQRKCSIERLAIARDLLLAMCYLGVRISDLHKLEESFVDGQILRDRAQKTGFPYVIPLVDDEILQPLKMIEKYKGVNRPYLFPYMANAEMNVYLKNISCLAGCKNKLMTKMGRKTFVTYMSYVRKMPHIEIMQCTGHRTFKSFMRYFGIDEQALLRSAQGSVLKVS